MQWIITAHLPFSTIENQQLRAILLTLQPDVALFGRETLRREIQNELGQRKPDWIKYFEVSVGSFTCTRMLELTYNLQTLASMVSIALDAWTSSSRLPFLGITVKWIGADWMIRTVVIGFERLVGAHTGENLSETLEEVLREFKLLDKVHA